MTDNVLQTLQHAIQDVIAPDVRELKVRVSSIEKQMETQYNALQKQIETTSNSLRDQQEANFQALMAAIGESKAKSDLETYKLIAALTERVAALEASRN
ncbi:hypothetical protein [Silvibacterium dinghuense]|uniref:Uncharacterized protein n=1 Tax=Silvibacterium dinghuense TaxID=1560006 RepID=A0A4Q1SIK5_9BACT|nr:hypothetical protein [Silvibacterium dinghuense]RXS97233.1 hypothetical protein ESZ00_04785 [Silvibacterium dinghuense]GGG97302.1 hypothetical protein GCM10011586_10730 [Silvibacterium dinghuense]